MAKLHPLSKLYFSYLCIGITLVLLVNLFYTKKSVHIIRNIKSTGSLHRLFNFTNTRNEECSGGALKAQRARRPFVTTTVTAWGSFLDRCRTFNEELDKLRLEALRSRCTGEWKSIAPHQEITLIQTSRDDFIQRLANFSQLQLVVLPWNKTDGVGGNYSSLKDGSNLLIQNYYEWTADDPLCTWIETPGTIRAKYSVMHNRMCYRDVKRSITPQSINMLILNAKPINRGHYWPNDGQAFPSHFYTEQPPFTFYMYIIRDGIVTGYSDVYSGSVKLVQYACSRDINTKPPSNVDKIPIYDEIFPIAQYWGTGNFHRMVEIIPRLSLYLDFLKRNPKIKILAPETGGRTAELIKCSD